MKRFLAALVFTACAISPAMSQGLFGSFFGSTPTQVQSAPRGYTHYGRHPQHTYASPMSGMITETANRYGVSPALVHAIARKESGGRCIGGRGIMQVNRATARSMGIHGNSCPENLAAGVLYLKQSIAMHGYGCAAFSAYQSGLGVHRCSAYGRSIMAMMHGGSPATYEASYHRHYASYRHRITRFASYHHHRATRYAAYHHRHYTRYASR